MWIVRRFNKVATSTQTVHLKNQDDYKQVRAEYVFSSARRKGFDYAQSKWLIAQVFQENGAMTADRRGDAGCSVGLTQWNECARGKDPSGGDWKKQIDIFLEEVWTKYQKNDNFYAASVSWNSPRAFHGVYKTKYYYHVLNKYNNYILHEEEK